MITKRYLTGGINGSTHGYSDTTALVGHTTAFDRAGNKLYERHLEAESRSHLYQPFNSDGSFGLGYDSANRLRQYQRGVLSSATIPFLVNPGASISTPTTLPGADQVHTYGLDGLGNWKTSNFAEVGSGGSTTSTAEVRQHNYVNEITSVTDTIGGTPSTTPFVYDKNGNLLNDGIRLYQYDAFNRLIQVSNASTSVVLATYIYDALNRRIQKTISNLDDGYGGLTGDIPAGTTDYLYDGQQIIEERNDGSPTAWTKVYFWGQYIDELMFFAVPTESGATVYRVLSDLLYRSTALVTTSNVVTEAYDTDAYGNTLCYSGPGTDDEWFTDDDVTTHNPINATIFTGRLYDPESQIYYYRARYYSPSIGRFLSRDPLKNAALRQGPNLYWYVRNNAVNKVDPMGLACCCPNEDQACVAAAKAAITLINNIMDDWNNIQALSQDIADAQADIISTGINSVTDELTTDSVLGAMEVNPVFTVGNSIYQVANVTTDINQQAQYLQALQQTLNLLIHNYYQELNQLDPLEAAANDAWNALQDCLFNKGGAMSDCQCQRVYGNLNTAEDNLSKQT